jgi:hypothetical protein
MRLLLLASKWCSTAAERAHLPRMAVDFDMQNCVGFVDRSQAAGGGYLYGR